MVQGYNFKYPFAKLKMLRNPKCDLCTFGVHSPNPPQNVCIMQKVAPHDVMIVAEIAGGEDDRYGSVFSDKLLRTFTKFVESEGLDCHYTYAVKCRKPSSKAKVNPSSHVKVCSKAYLAHEIIAVAPKHIICMGSNAFYAVTGQKGFAATQGQRFWSDKVNAWIYPTYHSASVMFDVNKRKAFWNELKMYVRMIKGESVVFDPPYKVCTTLKGLRKVARLIKESGGYAACDTETDGFDMFIDGKNVRCLQLCWDLEYGGVFIPLGLAEEADLYNGTVLERKLVMKGRGKAAHEVEQIVEVKIPADPFWASESLLEALEIVREILLTTWLSWANGKFDRKWLWEYGRRTTGSPLKCPKIWMDVQHVAHLLDENRDSFKLKKLFTAEFGLPSYDIPDKLTKDLSVLVPYSSYDPISTLMLTHKYSAALDEPENVRIKALYYKVIRPMDRMYTEMELEGWPVSLAKAKEKEAILEPAITEIVEQMDSYLESKGIIVDRDDTKRYTSSEKLATLIFDDLNLPVSSNPKLAFTDDGKRSTEVDALLHIRKDPFLKLLSKYKKSVKALTTYVRPMIKQAQTRGKISTSYKLIPVTGRTSSGKENPKSTKGMSMNTQNIPMIYGIKEIVAMDELNPVTGQVQVIGDVDFSQIELRVAAEESRDPLMLWAYSHNVDLHTYRAVRSMGIDKELLSGGLDIDSWHKVLTEGEWSKLPPDVQKNKRKRAKPDNFGYLYGMSAETFVTYAAKGYDIDISLAEGKESRDLYFHDHAALPKWYARVEAFGHKHGYVESLAGRRRRLPVLKTVITSETNKEVRRAYSDAYRQGVNSPVQGFASDLKLMSLVAIRKELKARGWWGVKCMIFGEVHDSIVFRVDADIALEVAELMVSIMRHPPLLDELGIKLTVPIEAEASIGPSLGEQLEPKIFARWRAKWADTVDLKTYYKYTKAKEKDKTLRLQAFLDAQAA